MFTDVQLINNGLSKIASSRINRLDPASTPLEQFMKANYQQWKRSELTRRRWVFALEDHYKLTKTATLTDVRRPYKYALPINCLRPVRERNSEWVQRGRFIFSANDDLYIDYIRNVDESEFDPLFNEVLSCKIAFESAEYVTQSTTKKQTAFSEYNNAVRDAGLANAFVIGSEATEDNDDNFDWVRGHHG
jgi:hypothetical protein